MKVLLATNNQGKAARFKRLLEQADAGIELCTPKELHIDGIDVDETGATLAENAERKARAYAGMADMPILANDIGLYVAGEGFMDAPKRTALGGVQEHYLTQEEIARKLLNFWKGIAQKHGGSVDAAWVEAFVAVYPDGSVKRASSRREIILTDRELGEVPLHLPIRALYYSKATNKPAIQHTEEEEWLEMQPVIDALIAVLAK
ncbi:MAG: hypothetical protein HYT31_04035 [Parcubacteria group bacterium]|nr:hypothetical protein [Parcubacteria group bacterium]